MKLNHMRLLIHIDPCYRYPYEQLLCLDSRDIRDRPITQFPFDICFVVNKLICELYITWVRELDSKRAIFGGNSVGFHVVWEKTLWKVVGRKEIMDINFIWMARIEGQRKGEEDAEEREEQEL